MTNIAIIVLDTVRKDYFDEYFDWIEGLYFENAYSTANWTGAAHASLFTGEYGSTVGVSSKSRTLDCKRDVLPEQLSSAGYTTRGWSANPNISSKTMFDRGFDIFDDPSQLKTSHADILDLEIEMSKVDQLPTLGRYIWFAQKAITADCDTMATLRYGFDEVFNGRGSKLSDDGASVVLERLRNTQFGSNEFLFVNLMEAHTPYYPPEEYREFEEPIEMPFGEAYHGVDDPAHVRKGYEASVQYLGDIYKYIFPELVNSFDYVITLSDHGELLGEHGMWNHVSGIYPELTHIPLVISGPGLDGVTDGLVSLLDVYTTIMDIANIGFDGDDSTLLEDYSGERYLAEYRGPFSESIERSKNENMGLEKFDKDLFALIEADFYGYEDYDGWQEVGHTDLENPKERLHELVDHHEMRSIDEEEMNLDDDTKSQLADLGYM